VLVDELEGFDQTKRLVDRTSDRQVIDGHLSKDTLKIGNENTFLCVLQTLRLSASSSWPHLVLLSGIENLFLYLVVDANFQS
jgi:hypothetical protein